MYLLGLTHVNKKQKEVIKIFNKNKKQTVLLKEKKGVTQREEEKLGFSGNECSKLTVFNLQF